MSAPFLFPKITASGSTRPHIGGYIASHPFCGPSSVNHIILSSADAAVESSFQHNSLKALGALLTAVRCRF
jgi:hypothetical protein